MSTDPASYDAIYLSPHLDDAVLSCGGQIHRRVAAGQRVLILTLFTGDFSPSDVSEATRVVLDLMALPIEEAMAIRRQEDLTACRTLGAELIHCPLPEALARRDARGEPVYGSLKQLFGPMSFADFPFVNEVAGALRGLPEAKEVFTPLTIGSHVDHQVVRQAAEDVFGLELRYYEDFPYVAWRRFAIQRVLGWRKKGWSPEVVALDEQNLEARIEAIRAYSTQIQPLFKSDAGISKLVRAWARKVGGERLWRRI